jgi:hypothetical protein
MCDYSLHAVASRPARVGETIVTTGFYGTSTRGFASKEEPGVAVCLLPGTELAFEHEVRYNRNWLLTKNAGFCVARFCAIEPRAPHQHHDALSFPDGNTVLVNLLSEGNTHGCCNCRLSGANRTSVARLRRPTLLPTSGLQPSQRRTWRIPDQARAQACPRLA